MPKGKYVPVRDNKRFLRTVRRLSGELDRATKAYHRSIASAFPPGTEISYRHGNGRRYATVVNTSADRLLIIGASMSKYWIHHDLHVDIVS